MRIHCSAAAPLRFDRATEPQRFRGSIENDWTNRRCRTKRRSRTVARPHVTSACTIDPPRLTPTRHASTAPNNAWLYTPKPPPKNTDAGDHHRVERMDGRPHRAKQRLWRRCARLVGRRHTARNHTHDGCDPVDQLIRPSSRTASRSETSSATDSSILPRLNSLMSRPCTME